MKWLTLLLLSGLCMAQTQYTLNNHSGIIQTSTTISMNTTLFQSMDVTMPGSHIYIFRGPDENFPLMGLTDFRTGEMVEGDYDAGAKFAPGGYFHLNGTSYSLGYIELTGTFLDTRWRHAKGPNGTNVYGMAGTILGTLNFQGVDVCSGVVMTFTGRSVNMGTKVWSETAGDEHWLQYLSVNTGVCHD